MKETCSKRTWPRDGRQRQRPRLVLHLRAGVEDLEDALAAGHRLGDRRDHVAEPAHRHQQLSEVSREGHQFAQGQPALHDQCAAVPDDRNGAEVGDKIHQRQVDGLQPGCPDCQAEPDVVLRLEASDLGLFLGETLDHPRAAQVLFEQGRDHGELLLDGQRHRAESAAEVERPVGQEGHGQHGQDGKARVHQRQRHGGGRQQQCALDGPQKRPAGQEAYDVHVLNGASQQLPAARPVEIGE